MTMVMVMVMTMVMTIKIKIFNNRIMNEKFVKDLSLLLDASSKLTLCAKAKCAKTLETLNSNTEFKIQMLKIIGTKNLKDKTSLITKLVEHSDVINHNKCIYKHCKQVYMDLLNILIKVFDKFANDKEFKTKKVFPHLEMSKILNEIKTIIQKKTLTTPDFKKLQKNKILLFSIISNNKP